MSEAAKSGSEKDEVNDLGDDIIEDEEEWRAEFKAILDDIDHRGDFAVGQKIGLPPLQPKISVEGMDNNERLAFPLVASQAERLRSVAEKAPYGKGTETVLDESVRKAWQIDASKVHFADTTAWQTCLKSLVQQFGASLGLSTVQQGRVQANLNKMLLYEPGGHFKRHRDTEKEPGMFGTLVIQLPSRYSGGALVIQHGGETKTLDFASESQDAFFATAFYADCEHELQAVTEGWRLCLVYNLVIPPTSSSFLPSANVLTAQARKLRTLATQWNQICLERLQGYVLEHKYTETNLHFRNLKGRDKEVVDLLREAHDVDGQPLFVVCLLLLEKWESGSPDDGGYYHYRRSYYDSEGDSDGGPHTMGEVHDENTSANHWVGPDDKIIAKFNVRFDMESCLLLDEDENVEDLFEGSPDKEEYEGYTGNAGPTLDYWYYRGAVVFWPKSNQLEVSAMAGLDFVVSCLNSASASEAPHLAAKAVELVEKGKGGVSDDLLRGLLRVSDAALMVRVLKKVSVIPSDQFAKILVDAMVQMESAAFNQTVLEVLRKTASGITASRHYGYSSQSASGYLLSCSFLNHLEQANLADILPIAREMVIKGALSNAKPLVSSSNGVEQIAEIAFCCPALLPAFVDTVVQQASPSKIGSVLKALVKLEGAVDNAEVRRLYEHRVGQLKQATRNGVPSFSWRQSQVRFEGSQATAVNAFLHSDEQSATFGGFNGISHARNWANKYFGWHSSSGKGYSAKASPGGRGSGAYVSVTKTKKAFEGSLQQYEKNMQELNRLASIFGETAAGSSGSIAVPVAATSNQTSALASEKRPSATHNTAVSQKRSKPSHGGKENPIYLE